SNLPPNKPVLISPLNKSNTYLLNGLKLFWTCTDPNPDDFLKYNLYFDTNPNNLKLKQNEITNQSYVINNLKNGETYYWKIQAFDKYGATNISDISSFKIDT